MKLNRNNMNSRRGAPPRGTLATAVLGTVLVTVAGPAASAQSFTGLGFLPGASSSSARAVSADGSTVVGSSGQRVFRWTRDGGMQSLGVLEGGPLPFVRGVSADGAVIVGFYYSNLHHEYQVFRWTQTDGMQSLVNPPNWGHVYASDISDDGTIVVGYAVIYREYPYGTDNAFRWTVADGFQVLGVRPGDQYAQSSGISGDGRVIVGWAGPFTGGHAVRWTGDGTIESLGVLPGWRWSVALAANADGSAIVGAAHLGEETRTFYWTEAKGIREISTFEPTAVNADGTVVVGGSFMWRADLGTVTIHGYLSSRGINLNGWTQLSVFSVSADGLTFCGTGTNPSGQREGWIAAPCPADFNADYRVNSQDYFDFLSAFFTAEPAADFNADGTVDTADFFDFLTAFFAGCA